ncbi:aldehyde dehydrogenase family protein [Seongchinamella sediminis]|uniref:Aldehyde dehydrogenase n=1 Tax=Seongchinamella sediminis TaxID=2283635 RepID=A0A3L7DRX9_9GAMM|nr:coniferyl aldehyde dehydrogenase [Seongchinamella sediminis]RLQ20184.1 aldehyde dehydrogenase family protein [Seongchinamella sediminis]
MTYIETSSADLARILQNQRRAFESEGPVALETRVDRIERCIALIVDHQDALCAAVNEDFGGRSQRVTRMSDLFTSVNTLKFVKKYIRKWMKPERRRAPFPMNLLGARADIYYQPKGVVGIMSPWNVPINVVFSPLADVLGAGNRAMIKPSEFNPKTVAVLSELFRQYFDETEIAVVSGGADVGSAFSSLPLDHIIFTGAGQVGKLVMRSAAQNLTPVTLELGGKSPVIVSQGAKLEEAAEKIIAGKAMNAGQVCISPDYCFVPEEKTEAFISHCQQTIANQYPTFMHNDDFVSLINERNFDRVQGYITDARAKNARVVTLSPEGEDWNDRARHRMPIHLVIDPSDDMKVMQEELFGPVLCVLPYSDLGEVIVNINRRPHPLAMYYFGHEKKEQEYLIANTTAGGMSINDIGVHFACDDMPFGGVGASGMGHFHGREGFKTFSHAKSVFRQGFLNLPKLSGSLPPYGDKVDRMMDAMIKK